MSLSQDTVRTLLAELADWLEFEESDPVEWVVCGGVAMSLQNLNTRTTRDVDVLGNWNAALAEIARVEEFTDKVKSCIRRVAENHPELAGFGDNWVNLGPRKPVQFGLPKGFEQRLTTMQFGANLKLHLLGRDDLLPLKLYAAADEFGPRQEVHFQDIRALNPSFPELDKAVDWVRTLPDFESKRPALKNVVEELGYDDLAYYI